MTGQSFLKYMNFGWQLLAGMGVFTGAGYWVDQKLGSSLCTLAGIIIGIVYCGFLIWRLVKDVDKS
ncbi:MAG: AtpZ/AtpI family protein [Candidatus Omnitrophica bacterium]|nr:AtpZ/AtpI family protein [Candidatus Omnitrophota bacterium]